MLTKRIIACLDVKNGRVVKGKNFIGLRDAGDPADLACKYYEQGADEIVFLDITATKEKRKAIAEVVRKVAKQIFIPLTVGGGIQSVEDIRAMLKAGADKVSLNSAAVRNPELIREAAQVFGSQCIVVAIDAKKDKDSDGDSDRDNNEDNDDNNNEDKEQDKNEHEITGKWKVYVNGGSKRTEIDAIRWAKKAEMLGAGEILLTSMDCDGIKGGYDLELTRRISNLVKIPVIASGGAGEKNDIAEVLTKGEADAALAASIFHYNEENIAELKAYLLKKDVRVRIC